MVDKELLKKGIRLEYATAGWAVIGAIAALAAGAAAGSIALIGFGLHSVIAAVLAAMFLRRLRLQSRGQDSAEEQNDAERKTFFVAGAVFFLLALYLLSESGSRLYYGEKGEAAVWGLALAVLSLIITAVLTVMKLRTATALGSGALRDDARETAVRGLLSLILLLGLGLHAQRGWWWADPVSALMMLPLIVREGWEAVEQSKDTGGNEIAGMNT